MKQRIMLHESKSRTKAQKDWNNDRIELDFLEKAIYVHKKIPLDIETGDGVYQMD